jgi:hypothetical protein
MTDVHDQLDTARLEPCVVRVTRGAFEADGELGYVLSTSADLILLLAISSQIRFDGFVVIRIRDITELEVPHDHSDFVEEALRLRGESVSEAPAVDLSSITEAIRTAGQLHTVVAIHREEVEPEICHLGAVLNLGPDSVSLLEIDPDAEWDTEPTSYALSEVTRVEFAGGYEEALALVGGKPPSVRHLKPVS